ncbi:hypothetical protein VKT23_011559 [Stygiomarasmius scandens]|uniref:Uncharacterized protein n=1 Tax=Marasmiellus scandens TaxID=2682957 RepID=A0ABR1JDP0_9AGAR
MNSLSVEGEELIGLYQQSVVIKVWCEDGKPPVILPTHVKSFPMFTLQQCSSLFDNILGGNDRIPIATFDSFTLQWQCHTATTVRMVRAQDTLLYCLLPDGITGNRISVCPGLESEIAMLMQQATFHYGLEPCLSTLLPHSTLGSNQLHGAFYRRQHCDEPVVGIKPRKPWPHSYTVALIASSFQTMQPVNNRNAEVKFNSAFPDARFICSTFWKHFRLWEDIVKSSPELIALNPDIAWSKLVSFKSGTRPGKHADIKLSLESIPFSDNPYISTPSSSTVNHTPNLFFPGGETSDTLFDIPDGSIIDPSTTLFDLSFESFTNPLSESYDFATPF